jgi:hypothetical protein
MSDLHDFHNWVLTQWMDAEAALSNIPEHRKDKGKGLCLNLNMQHFHDVEMEIERFYTAFPEKDKRTK